jgi:DNA polymerase-3 subunit delta'
MTFRNVRGHDETLARLARAVATRPASAWLLVGPAGIGKRRVADALASRLLCEAVRDDDACGACRHCVRVDTGTHPDVLVVVRDEDRRDLRVDQIRALIQWFALRPMMAARKVAIVDGAHDLNEAGQNALLKTLEEPPGDAAIILVADALSRLLPTVRSRCRRLRFDPLPPGVVAAVLAERGIDGETAARLAARSGGSIGRALALADPGLEDLRARTLSLLGDLGRAAAVDLSAFAADLGRGDTAAGLDVVVSWYRDLLRVALGGPETAVANVEARAAIATAAARTAPHTALRLLEVVCDTVEAVGRNANKTLAIETSLLELRRLVRRAERASWTSPAA